MGTVWGGIVLEKQHSFWWIPLPFGDHCLLHFVQERCVVACCHCSTLFEVFSQQYPVFVPETRCHYVRGWLICSEHFLTREQPCLHSLDSSFVSGSYKYIHVSYTVASWAKKPSAVHLRCPEISCEATTTRSCFLSSYKHFGTHLAERFLISNIWMINITHSWDISRISSLFFGWNSPVCPHHAVNSIHIFRHSDHKWPIWTVFIHYQCWNVLSSLKQPSF